MTSRKKVYLKGFLAIFACAFAAFYLFQSFLFYGTSGSKITRSKKPRKIRKLTGLFRETDISACDARAVFNKKNARRLLELSFDTLTLWPERFPASFSPAEILERGKDPGLNINLLHKKNITGKGVSIAVIDQRIFTGHKEYKDRLEVYGEFHYFRLERFLKRKGHGEGMVSVIAGKTCGIAPGSKIYYLATDPGTLSVFSSSYYSYDLKYLALAVERILRESGDISAVVFASVWPDKKLKGYEYLLKTLQKVSQKGIFIASPLSDYYGYRIGALTRNPLSDPNRFSSYSPFKLFAGLGGEKGEKVIFVPGDSRTVASPYGENEYAFLRHSKYSVAVSYMAGLWALCKQAKPDLSPREFMKEAYGSSRRIKFSGREIRIVNPVKLVSRFEKKGGRNENIQ